MKLPSFDVSEIDNYTISAIATRATKVLQRYHISYDLIECAMDLTACHANGCPLDLTKLLRFEDAQFIHDVVGIRNHLDRTTGTLLDHFLPRCAQGQSTTITLDLAQLDELILRWKLRAKRKFEDADKEPNEMGRRLINHGAFCYFNAATELEALLQIPADAPLSSETPAAGKACHDRGNNCQSAPTPAATPVKGGAHE